MHFAPAAFHLGSVVQHRMVVEELLLQEVWEPMFVPIRGRMYRKSRGLLN